MRNSQRLFALLGIVLLGLFALKSLAIGNDVLTLMDPASPAWASEHKAKKGHKAKKEETKAELPAAHEDEEDAAQTGDDAAADPAACAAPSYAEQTGLSEQELNVVKRLSERRRALDRRENSIETREGVLQVTSKKLDERLAKLTDLEAAIKKLLGQLDGKEAEQIAALTKLYSTMKPKPAAAIFATLDEDVLIKVAGEMKAEPLAKIMAAMPADKASALTLSLAQRHIAPTEASDLPGFAAKSP